MYVQLVYADCSVTHKLIPNKGQVIKRDLVIVYFTLAFQLGDLILQKCIVFNTKS